ncbi:MAG TPA: calcium/sodium antiporter [Glaciecola sp.]|nr:calcium/sodium antiporter [Glaciecola sp.]
MMLAVTFLVLGFILLIYSASRFVEGSAVVARYLGMPPLLIGMVVVGFGTSSPELVVSVTAAANGNSTLALGNAFGSNIANIALIIGLVALINPIIVRSEVIKKELPILFGITMLVGWLISDKQLSRFDACYLLVAFILVILWSIFQGMRNPQDQIANDLKNELNNNIISIKKAIMWLVIGLILLIAASRMLVYGAVYIAQGLGISDLVIGLTVVAIGTSLPELASSLVAIKKGENDMALGNIIGSNLFNTLAVIGLAALVQPMEITPEVISRDWTLMMALTLSLLILGIGIKKQGRINRFEGALLLITFFIYTTYLYYASF